MEDIQGERVVQSTAVRTAGKNILTSYLAESSRYVYYIFVSNQFGASNWSAPVEISRLISVPNSIMSCHSDYRCPECFTLFHEQHNICSELQGCR